METSILKTIKKILGIDASYTAFDVDIITHINSVFSTLHQLGIGPAEGFIVEDDQATWSDFFGVPEDPRYHLVKTYIYTKVRLVFDPPGTSYLINAFENQIREMEWRLNTMREETDWVDPDPDPEPEPAPL